MERAETLRGVKFSCDPRPLRIEELPKFFVETAKARDPSRIGASRSKQGSESSNVTVEQLLILAIERVLDSARDFADEISDDTIDEVYGWFADTLERREDSHGGTIEVGSERELKQTAEGDQRVPQSRVTNQ